MNIKDYIGKHFVGKRVHFTCNCVTRLDLTGLVVGYSILSNEVVFDVDVNGRIVKIGENTSKLNIELV